MKNIAIFTILSAVFCGNIFADDTEANSLTLAYSNNTVTKMAIPSIHKYEAQASEQEMENLNKAMEKLNAKLNKQLESRISRDIATSFE